MLDQLHIPTDAVLCSKVNCTLHNVDLENYYCSIVKCLQNAASNCVPQVKVGIEKHMVH